MRGLLLALSVGLLAAIPAKAQYFPGGGAGGNVGLYSATSVTVAGTINISAGNGGNGTGTAPAAGGGGGGGGGEAEVFSPSNSTGSLTLTRTGGAHGNGTTGGAAGIDGSAGSALTSITGTPNQPLLSWRFSPEGVMFVHTAKMVALYKGDYRYGTRHGDVRVVSLHGTDLCHGAGHSLDGFCYFLNGDSMSQGSCMGVGDAPVSKDAA